MIVTNVVDKEQFEAVINRIHAKKSEMTTSMGYDEKLRKDIINGRFFDGRVAVENDYIKFCGELIDMLAKCAVN